MTTLTFPDWLWTVIAFVLGLAGYGALGVLRGAKRRAKERIDRAWESPSLPGTDKRK